MLLHNGYRRIPQTPGSRLHRTDGCPAPATIAASVYSGHRFARDLGESTPDDATPCERELVALTADFAMPGSVRGTPAEDRTTVVGLMVAQGWENR